jgi:hypothetical protein
MFAPLVAKAKSTGPQPAKAADQTHTPRLSLGDQATTSFVAAAAEPDRERAWRQNNRIQRRSRRRPGDGPLVGF